MIADYYDVAVVWLFYPQLPQCVLEHLGMGFFNLQRFGNGYGVEEGSDARVTEHIDKALNEPVSN